MSDELLAALGGVRGVVCAVGAGGKKSTLYAIARQCPGRVAVTSTVFTAPFSRQLDAHRVVAPAEQLDTAVIEASAHHTRIAYALPSDKKARLAGVAPARVAALHRRAGFDVTLVKADGARMRLLKAPRQGEPVLPPGTDTVLPVVSVQAVGRVLDEQSIHRVAQVAAVTGALPGGRLAAGHLARLLASPDGALRGVGEARVIPIINMVDDARWQRIGREIAEAALAGSSRLQRVVLAAMNTPQPVVEVIAR